MLETCYNCYYSGPMNPAEEHPEFVDPLECRKPINATEKMWPLIWPIVESDFSCLNFRAKDTADIFTQQIGVGGTLGGGISPASSTKYYLGPITNMTNTGIVLPRLNLLAMPFKCVLDRFAGYITTQGTLGTNEPFNLYMRRNNTEDILLTDNMILGSAEIMVLNYDMNIAIAQWDNLEFHFTTPNFGYLSTGVRMMFTLYFKRTGV